MHYNDIDLNLLSALKVLLEKRSVTGAGRALHISQSAMSGILTRLRDHFGDPLITPSTRGMELTPLGEYLVNPINDIMDRIDATIKFRPKFDPEKIQRRFVIAASDYVSATLLCDVLSHIHHEAPGMTWKFRQPDAYSCGQLDSGDVDFIICPMQYASHTHPSTRLFDDSYVIAVDRNNPEISREISLEQYLAAGHVSYQTGRNAMPLFESWFARRYGADLRRVEVNTNSFHLLPHLVVGTNRVATLHARMVDGYVRSLPIRLVKPLFELPELAIVLQWHRHREKDCCSQWLRERILGCAQTLPAIGSLNAGLLAG